MPITIIKAPRQFNLVKLKKYCEKTGDTQAAVHARRNKGIWLDGKHTVIGPDGNVWVNIDEVEKWVKHGNLAKA